MFGVLFQAISKLDYKNGKNTKKPYETLRKTEDVKVIKSHWSGNGYAQTDKVQKTFEITLKMDGLNGGRWISGTPEDSIPSSCKVGVRAFGPQKEPEREPNTKNPMKTLLK